MSDSGALGDQGVLGDKSEECALGEEGDQDDLGDQGDLGALGDHCVLGEEGDLSDYGDLVDKGNLGKEGVLGDKGEEDALGEVGDLCDQSDAFSDWSGVLRLKIEVPSLKFHPLSLFFSFLLYRGESIVNNTGNLKRN